MQLKPTTSVLWFLAAILIPSLIGGATAYFLVSDARSLTTTAEPEPVDVAPTNLPTHNGSDRTAHKPNVTISAKLADDEAWKIFMGSCRQLRFDEARELVSSVVGLPLAIRLEALELAHEVELTVEQARTFLTVLLGILSTSDPAASRETCDAIIRELEVCWPSSGGLESPRKEQYATKVEGKPVSIPERSAFVPMDVVIVTTYLEIGKSLSGAKGLPLLGVTELFNLACAKPRTARAYFEPALSAMLGILKERGEGTISALVQPYVAAASLTERLRWELKVYCASAGSTADLIALLEGCTDSNDVIAALRAAFAAGIDVADLHDVLVPYLESRFGSRSASNYLMISLTAGLAKLTESERRQIVLAASEAFCTSDPESGLATVYFAVLRETEAVRWIKQSGGAVYQQIPDLSSMAKVLPSPEDARFRRALVDYWRTTVSRLGPDQLSTNSPGGICLAAVQNSNNLGEAVDTLEAIISTCRQQDLRIVVREFHLVIIACRGLFTSELSSDRSLRRRLVALTESLLALRSDTTAVVAGQEARNRAMVGILLADQVLAICAIEEPLKLSPESAVALRSNVVNFEAEAFVPDSQPRILVKSLRKYESPYQRVLSYLEDHRLVPPK